MCKKADISLTKSNSDIKYNFTGSEILYFDNNDLSLPRFRPGGNDSKNRSEHCRSNWRQRILEKILTYYDRYNVNSDN